MIKLNEREKSYIILKGHDVDHFSAYYEEHLELNELEHTAEEFYASFEMICEYIKEDDKFFAPENAHLHIGFGRD